MADRWSPGIGRMAMRTASGSTSPIEGSSCRARRTRSRASGIDGLSLVSKLNAASVGFQCSIRRRIMGPAWDLHTHSFLLDDEIRAAFEICRKRGFKVMAHATNPDAVKNAIRLGAHSIEHGYIMDDECIALLLEHDTWYVPTLAISHLTASQA